MSVTIFHSVGFYSLNNTVGKAIQNDPLLKSINSCFWYTSRKKWIPIGLTLHNISLLFYDTISVHNKPKNQGVLEELL
jgi:hypothetical protein